MGPRKAKEIIDDDNYWRLCIEEALLNDETWTVKIILIESAGSEQDRIYLNKFENYAAEEKRFVIKNICKTETIFMINQLGGEKKVKDDNLRVFEEGQIYLKEKKDVPSEIMALIIKHLILKMKEEYIFIKRQRLEVHEGMKKESVAMINKSEVKEIVNIKNSEPQNSIPPVNKQKKGEEEAVLNPTDVDENKKYSTLLRVRGEEWRDKIYIDDYPTDGPNLYVAITGFLDPNLAGCLIKFGIPLTAIVQIRIDLTSKTIPSSLFRATKRGQSQTEVLTEKSIKFWEDLQQLRINRNSCNDFKDTAFIVFTPPYWKSESISGCAERIYDELCYLMYDIQDLTRQHVHYLNNMNIISISGDNKMDSYLSLYHKHINGIPFESLSTYLILDAILQTVCENESWDKSYTTPDSFSNNILKVVPTYQTKNEEDRLYQSENLVKELINQFNKVDLQKKKYKVTDREEHYDYKNTIMLQYGDFCKLNTFHLGNLNLDSIVYSMLLGMPVNKLWQNRNEPTEEIKAKINFHVNLLLSCFVRDDVETAQLNRFIHILACRKLYNNRSSLRIKHTQPSTIAEFKKTYLKRSILAEPLTKYAFHKCQSSTTSSFNSVLTDQEESFEFITDKDEETSRMRYIFECPDISELVSATEIANQKPNNHIIDEFEFYQDFNGSIAFQIILNAFNKYNCIDYKYCEVTDCFVMMFYNSNDKDGITRKEWRCHLPTPLCLQDFFDFVLEEHYDWIRNEEKVYDESIMLRSQSEYKDNKNASAVKSCVENSDIELELLMEGSLKYEQMNSVDLIDLETSNSKLFSSKKTNTSLSTADLDSMKSGRKTKSPVISTPKIICHEAGTDSHLDLSKKPFVGYDLGDRRVEIFGKDSTYFAKDGTRVTSCYSLTIPMNLEFVNLNIVPGNCNSEFWIHRALGGENDPNTLNISESFRINTKDHLIFYVKKQLYKKAFPLNLSGNTMQSLSQEINDVIPELHEMKSYHSLLVTWPNGLITETVHENNSSNISHIKQHYLTPLSFLAEDMRCISLNGEVIIFKSNSEIEILKPDSSYFKITKYEKRILNEEKSESVHSITSSDKSKKGKDKLNKASSKASSKKVLIEDEKIINKKPAEYELFIEEFEVIESNGLRQKWIQNNKFYIEKLLIKTATDYTLGEIFSKRMDGTHVLLNKDGLQVVTFPDNTRIITSYIIDDKEIYPEWTEEETLYFLNMDVLKSDTFTKQKNLEQTNNNSTGSLLSKKLQDIGNKKPREDGYISVHIVYTIEHANFTTVTINKYNGKISIKSPNNSCVTFDTENNFDFLLDEQTSAQFDGENLNMKYDACKECNFCTSCEIKIKSNESNSVPQLRKEWLKMTDLFRNIISVDEEGNIDVLEGSMNGEILQKTNPVCSEELLNMRNINKNHNPEKNTKGCQHKCEEICKAKSLKFFILRRDLTCSELIHRGIVERYNEHCRKSPWCSVNQYDTFGDNRSIWSILTPVRFNESEKWLMESRLLSKPKNLTYKHLKKDTGNSFYHWMRPYRRFQPKPIEPQPVLPERLPRAFILRTLEKQWNDSQREMLKGAKELVRAILHYRNLIEAESQTTLNIPIKDKRLECERKTDDMVQVIADRIYNELKVRLAHDIESRAKPMITTKPLPNSEDISLEELHDEVQKKSQIIEERQKAVTDIESVEATSPNLKRYWRRRAEEYKEEQFYKYLLREGSVPPYFRNVLGGSIWWDMNKAAGDAVENAERRNIRCDCEEQ